jgi:chromatin segregation and condensation protein Rec8/ScpA/Scc1 (kleisin family)
MAASANRRRFFVMKTIKTIEYPDSVAHFEAFMEGFVMALECEVWVNHQDDNISKIYFISQDVELQTSERKVWSVSTGALLRKYAAILARETKSQKTTINFIDGVSYQSSQFMQDHTEKLRFPKKVKKDPIGEDFIVLAEEIISGWEDKKDNELPQEQKTITQPATADQDKPKTPQQEWDNLHRDTQTAYIAAWRIYRQMEDQYNNDVADNQNEISKVTNSNWKTRVTQKVKKPGKKTYWDVGERTLQTVKRLGNAGVISPKKRKRQSA